MQTTKESASSDLSPVSVVVVNYNAGRLLEVCVREVLAQAKQVIVVDNASSDSSLELLEYHFAGETRLKTIRTGSNLGFAAACNIGIKQCTESQILFLNPDCELGSSSLRRLVQTLEANPDAGMVGGLLLDADGAEQSGARRAVPTPWRSFVRAFGLAKFADRWPRLFYDFHLHKQALPQHPIQVEAISGALMLVRGEAMEEVGLWDEGYFLHCEDLDWCMRFRQKDWNILFDPKAPVVHHQGACSRSRPVFVEWHKHKGMVRFYRKFFQHQYPSFLMWLVMAGVWVRFALVASVKTYGRIRSQGFSLKNNVAKPKIGMLQSGNATVNNVERKNLNAVAVVGATSVVGQALLPMLAQAGAHVIAYSRQPRASESQLWAGIEWRVMPSSMDEVKANEAIEDWIWLAPIRELPDHLAFMRRAGARRVVAVSTTSRFTKAASPSEEERQFVEGLIAAEEKLQAWAGENEANWTILRPTLIYGLGLDKNIGVIARFIRRFRFFPILGGASGLRQPIHARDVAAACSAVLERSEAANHAYNISGAERLSYRAMVTRIFEALSIRPRFLSIPLWMFAAGVAVLHVLPAFRSWSSAMAERMNRDMVFDHEDAARDFGFAPQPFHLEAIDLPAPSRRLRNKQSPSRSL